MPERVGQSDAREERGLAQHRPLALATARKEGRQLRPVRPPGVMPTGPASRQPGAQLATVKEDAGSVTPGEQARQPGGPREPCTSCARRPVRRPARRRHRRSVLQETSKQRLGEIELSCESFTAAQRNGRRGPAAANSASTRG